MTFTNISRRDFLSTAAATVATVAITAGPATATANTNSEPTGTLCGRVAPSGIAAGTAQAPSHGKVILLDGRSVTVAHVHSRAVRGGGSVLVAKDEAGGWSILYAEA